MADLFDQKSLRIPPMMGKAARTKLNKSGSYRMPPNLKGVHSAAQGGLGGAYTKGKKLRGFSGEDGSFVDPEGENGTPMTGLFGVGGQQIKPLEANFSSGLGDDEPESNGIPDDSPEAAGAALSGVGPKSPKDMNPDDIPASMDLGSKRIQEELDRYMPYARQQLEGMQNPREGGLNLPLLQFAAGLMSPTRTGSFGESIGTGMNAGLSALANQRKQDMDYQILKAKLGLDVEKTPLEVATKLADLDERDRYHQELMSLRRDTADNKDDLSTAYGKEAIKQGVKAFKEDAAAATKNTELLAYLGLPGEANSIEYNIDKVGTGPLEGDFVIPKAKIGDEEYTNAVSSLQQQMDAMKLAGAELMRGTGPITENERALVADFVGGKKMNEASFKRVVGIFRKNRERMPDMLKDWQSARESGETDYLNWKNGWLNKRYMDERKSERGVKGGDSTSNVKASAPKGWIIEEIGSE